MLELMRINPAGSKSTAIKLARKSDATVAYVAKSKLTKKWVTIQCFSQCAIEEMEKEGPACWDKLIRIK